MNRQLEILELVRTGAMTIELATAELAKLNQTSPTFAVSKTGAVQIKGLRSGKGQPVTLYKDELAGILAKQVELQEFVVAHDAELKNRADVKQAA